MSSIDERIVRMKFDNQGFESGVHTTMGTLEKLKNALKFDKISEGASKIGGTLQKLNSIGIGELNDGVNTTTAKFSALGVIATTALANITNSAVNAGKQLVSAFTIDPIKTGFSEYETKMGSIQTILANTAHHGTTLEDVNKALGDLNTYSDKTIYNFAEMAKNIGTFTAAGIDLDTSTSAIKGIANLAAISGSNSQQASTAMYQLSQALAAGRVSLADWNSVVNAGMGGKVFQDALIRTSEQLGTGAEAMIEKYGSFRDSLTKGEWLTTEVLTETLKQLSGAYTEADLIAQGYTESQAKQIMELAKTGESAATEVKTFTQLMDTMKESVQSGWAQTWEHIIGDKEQSTKLLTSISEGFNNIIGPSTEARNAMLKFWNENGGRDAIIKGLSNVFEGLGKGLGAVRDAFRDVFPAMTGQKLVEMSKGFLELTKNFKMSDETANKIKNTFKGLFTVVEFGMNIVKTLFSAFTSGLGVLKGLGSVFLTVTSSVGKFISSIVDAINKSQLFTKVSSAIDTAFKGLENVLTGVSNFIQSIFDSLGKIDLTGLFTGIGDAASVIANGFKSIMDGVGKAIGNFNFNSILTLINTMFAGGLVKSMTDLFNNIKGAASNLTGTFDTVKSVLGDVKDTLQAYQDNLNAGKLIKIAGAIGILAAALFMLGSVDAEGLQNGIYAMTALMVGLALLMNYLTKLDFSGITGGKGIFAAFSQFKTMGIAAMMLSMSASILILAAAVRVLCDLEWEELAKGLVGTAALLGVVVAATKLMSTQTKGMATTSAGLIIFAAALRALANVVQVFGNMDMDTMMNGLFSLAVLITEIALLTKLINFSKMDIGGATSLLILAGAINAFGVAVKSFGSMDADALVQGLTGVGVALLELALFSKMIKSSNLTANAVGITILAVAMNILYGAVRSFGSMNPEQLAVGLLGMAGALLILAVAADAMKSSKLISSAAGIALMGAALMVVADAVKEFGSIPLENLAIGILGMSASLLVLAVAMSAMSTGLAGAAAMLVMSAALAIFIPQLMTLSTIDPVGLAIALLAMAGAFLVLGAAGALLAPILPALLGLAAVIAVIGAGAALAGAGLMLMGTGLSLVAAAGISGGLVLVEIIRQLIGLLPTLGSALGEAFVNLVVTVGQAMPQIIQVVGDTITGILTKIIELMPQIFELAVQLISTFCMAVATCIPQIIQTGIDVVLALINGLAQNVGSIIQAGVDLINALAEGIRSNGPAVIDAIQNLLMALLELLWAAAQDFLKAAWEWIKNLASGIGQKAGEVDSEVNDIITKAITKAASAVGKWLKAGIDWIANLASGIAQKAGEVYTKVNKIITDAIKAAASKVGEWVKAGADMIGGLIKGIGQKAGELAEKAASAAKSALDAAKGALGIKSPSREFMKVGRYSMEGMVVGIDRYAHKVENSASGVANNALNTMTRSLGNMGNMIDGDIDVNPTIKPVMDLSNVEQGSRRIGDLLNANEYGITANTSGFLSGSIGTIQNGNDNSDILHALKDLKGALSDVGGTTYRIDGITYDDGSNVSSAVETLVRAAKIERRI